MKRWVPSFVLCAALMSATVDGTGAADAPAPRRTTPASAPRKHAKPEPAVVSPTAPPATASVAPAPSDDPTHPPKPEEALPVLGRKVFSATDEELGRVVNVLVDRDGRARAVVIDFGGFLGVGSRKVAVDWNELVFRPGQPERAIVVKLGREAIQKAPEYKDGAPGASPRQAEGDTGKREE
jgi:hypothetical protein